MRKFFGFLGLLLVTVATAAFAQTTCTPTGTSPSVTICSPASGATVSSPVQISAATTSSTTVQYIQVYVDGLKKYETTGGRVNTSLAMSAGQHRLTVQAFNGAIFKTTEMITVQSSGGSGGPCTLSTTNPSVTICQPADGSTVSSPFRIVAGTTSSTPVQFTQIYVDNAKAYQVNGGTLDTTLDLPSGLHRVTVQAYNGAYFKTTENITVSTSSSPPPSTLKGVFTYKYNNARMGANTSETTLTLANVNSTKFGKKGSWTVDGNIFAQPLYAAGLDIPGKGTKNVIFVATEHCSVYALNADAPGSAALWKKSFIDSANSPAPGNTSGRTSLGSEVCITGTPVIDANAGTMFVSVMTLNNGTDVHRLHALDIRTGSDKMTPTRITATVSGVGIGHDVNNKITFNPKTQNQRAALLLQGGIVYVAFGSFSDIQPYHGWLFAFSASNLDQLAAFNVTPDTEGGSIWQSGSGPAADSDGNVYVMTADGGFATGDFGDSILKLKLSGSSFTVMDWFTPYNEHCLNVNDIDLGSGGPMLLPAQGGSHPHELVGGSKEGRIYVVDRDSMGKHQASSDSQIVQTIIINSTTCGSSGFSASSSKRIYGAAAYWNGHVYLGSAFGPLRKYNLSSGRLSAGAVTSYIYQASGQSGRGPIAVISANGNTNGILWSAEKNYSTFAESMRAYDATTMKQLYSTTTNSARDSMGSGTVFTVPVVVNGRVIVTSSKKVFVFGLL